MTQESIDDDTTLSQSIQGVHLVPPMQELVLFFTERQEAAFKAEIDALKAIYSEEIHKLRVGTFKLKNEIDKLKAVVELQNSETTKDKCFSHPDTQDKNKLLSEKDAEIAELQLRADYESKLASKDASISHYKLTTEFQTRESQKDVEIAKLRAQMELMEQIRQDRESQKEEQVGETFAPFTVVEEMEKQRATLEKMKTQQSNNENLRKTELQSAISSVEVRLRTGFSSSSVVRLINEKQIFFGTTPLESTPWKDYSGINGMTVVVDTSKCGFPPGSQPFYFPVLRGDGNHWEVMGSNSVYKPENGSGKDLHNGFQIYLKTHHSVLTAKSNKWRIEWMAVLP